MEALIHPAAAFFGDNCWLMAEGKNSMWTKEENKKFERALAIFDEKTPDRWKKVAEMIPGKSVWDVIKQYKELEEDVSVIEAGLVPTPGYLRTSSSSFTFEWVDDNASFDAPRKKSSSMAARPLELQERRKGVPWTEEEHRRFLLGLQKHGKGDWRSISRNFVISKTPTQVASHAQKYFLRQLSVGKDKKRPSIHDITTTNLLGVLPSETIKTPQSIPLDQCGQSPTQHVHPDLIIPTSLLDWGHSPNDNAPLAFDGIKFPGHHNLYSCGRHGASYIG